MSLTYDPTEEGDDDLHVDMGDPVGDDDFSEEDQARARGWKPLSEFRGNPDLWVDAATFLRRGSEDPTMLRAENQRLGTTVARLSRRVERMEESSALSQAEHLNQLREMRKLIASGQNRDINAKRLEVTEARRGAIESGDVAAVDQFDEQLAQLQPVEEPPAAPAPASRLPPGEQVVIDDWTAANPWFFEDEGLRQTMMATHAAIKRSAPGQSLVDQLAEAKRRVQAAFPEKFGLSGRQAEEPALPDTPARRPAAAAVARPGGGAPPRDAGRRTAWDEIPVEERELAKSSYQTALRADPDQPAAEFVQLWLDPHLDVLELRRRRVKK